MDALAPQITPRPSHRSTVPRSGHGSHLFVLICATFVVSAIWIRFDVRSSDTVTLLVRGDDGARYTQEFSLNHGLGRISDDSQIPASSDTVRLSDGTAVALRRAGIVQIRPDGVPTVLIASPVPPNGRTKLAVWGDATLIAWVSPADGSVQVFERTAQGTYTPLHVVHDLQPNSLQFTHTGETLMVAKLNDITTELFSLSLKDGTVSHVSTIAGIVSVLAP